MASPTQIPIPTTLKWRPLPISLEEGCNKSVPAHPVTVDEANCYPCRRCLQDGKVGEEMLTLSYDPFLGDSPYRQYGPIFIHSTCKPIELDGNDAIVPEQQLRRLLSVRTFDKNHMMTGGDVFQGTELVRKAEELFKDEHVEYLHVHNAKPGCWAVRIDRAESH